MTRIAPAPKARKRPRLSKPLAPRPAQLTDLPDLPLARLTALLDPVSLARLRCTAKGAILPPDAVCDAMRDTINKCGSLPPMALTASWDTPTWLLQAHMALVTSEQPREAQERETYLERGAPSQYKLLRLEHEAAVAWRIQGYCISENLDLKREHAVALRSLDLSALFCRPFPGFERAPRGFLLEHLRLSTAVDPLAHATTDIPLVSLFENAPALRCLEVIPGKHSVSFFMDTRLEFPLTSFCWRLSEALESGHAPHLHTLNLDFSQARNPVRPELPKMLQAAIAKRTALTHVAICWPEQDEI